MVKELSASMTTKVIEEDSGTHRYVLERAWNKKGKAKMATVITLYPSTSELILTDTTTMLITNNIYKLGYDGFFSVNLYSKVNLPVSPSKSGSKRNFKTATNATNDKYILECAKNSEIVILAYGSLPSKNKQVQQRLDKVLTLLEKEGLAEVTRVLTDPEKKTCVHPLASKARNNWTF